MKKNECFKVKEDEFLALQVVNLQDSSSGFEIFPSSFVFYSLLQKMIRKEYKTLCPFAVEDVLLVQDVKRSWQEIKKGESTTYSVIDCSSHLVLFEIKIYLMKGNLNDEKNCID